MEKITLAYTNLENSKAQERTIRHLYSLATAENDSPAVLTHLLQKMEKIKAITKLKVKDARIGAMNHCRCCLMPFSRGHYEHYLKEPKSADSKLRRLESKMNEKQLTRSERKRLKYLRKKSKAVVVKCFFCNEESRFNFDRTPGPPPSRMKERLITSYPTPDGTLDLSKEQPDKREIRKLCKQQKKVEKQKKEEMHISVQKVSLPITQSIRVPMSEERKKEKLKELLRKSELKNSSLMKFLTNL